MLNIFYGRESVDKEKFIYDHLSGESLIIVPDQYTLEAEKDLIRRSGRKGLLDIEVLSFSRVSDRILSECGRSTEKAINKYGRYMLLVKIIEDVKNRLTIYQNISKKPSFVEMINDFLAQIRQNDISAERLHEIRKTLPEDALLRKKLEDICVIYDAYEEAIAGKYIDTETAVTFVAGKIRESSYVREKEIWISGFDSFTPKNLDLIKELIQHTRCVNVVLTFDQGSRDENLFKLTGFLMEELEKRAEECSIQKIEGYALERPEGLKVLEQELYAFPTRRHEDHAGITIVEAAGIHQEIETAAAYIFRLVRDEEYRYDDIAVICNSLEQNEAGIKRVFGKYGIPVFVDSKRKIMTNPLIIYFLAYLRLAASGMNSSGMLKMIKTGYSGIGQKDCDELENYVIENRIRKNGWKKEFTKIREGKEEILKRVEISRSRLAAEVTELSDAIFRCVTVHDACEAIYGHFVEKVRIVEKINEKMEQMNQAGFAEEAQLTVQSWNLILEMLQQMDEIMREEESLIERIPDIMEAGLEEAEAGIIPPVCDGVSVGTAQRSRIAGAKAVIVIGADEGVFPQAAGQEMLLNDDELHSLENLADVKLARTDAVRRNEETLGIYRTFARASEKLWIGTAMADEKGEKVKPSPVINTMLRIFKHLEKEQDMFADEEDPRLMSGRTAAADNMTAAFREYLDGGSLSDAWKEAAGWFCENDPEAMNRMAQGLFYSPRKTRMEKQIVKNLYQKGDGELSVSPSELESFSRCPFAHFMDYGLRPEERRVVEMAPREIGDVYHETFMKIADALTEKGLALTDPSSRWMTITEEEFQRMAEEIVQSVLNEYGGGFLLDRPEEKYRCERLKKLAKEIGWILVSHVRAGDIQEAVFEAYFGRRGNIPPVVVEAEGEHVYIEGIIDRLDILGNGRVKVIDYKTGKESFSEAEAKSGWKLQLMVYLKAGMEYEKKRKPAGVFYFHVKEPEADLTKGSRSAIKDVIEKEIYKSFKLDGAVIDEENVISSIAGNFEKQSDIVPVKRKDGCYADSGLSKRVFTDKEFKAFQDDVDETIQKVCEGIVAGDIDIVPKKKNHDTSACGYCRYRAICGFDTAFRECRYVMI